MVSREAIVEKLRQAFPDGSVELEDLTGTSDHFAAVVVSQSFEGKSRIEQHRMVYSALGGLMAADIHALQLTTMTPKTYEEKKR